MSAPTAPSPPPAAPTPAAPPPPAAGTAEAEVNVEINGRPIKAKKGEMIIRVTDAHDAYVPRFCYHDKLPIAANCRMCLVEVEKAPKPIPACSTPVTEGMKIFTRSPKAIAAQKATMEFLLINHPLDCPICDQGGECELQDLAMGFGRDISRFSERKRAVKDKNLGPLVSTDMTRCIHCTRCIRFGQDIAGIQEMGATGRGEDMEIGTFIERSIDHELSGNIIDLCPVGALNSKPFRYRGRGWEMTQHALISPHDGVGTNLYAHVLRGRLMRVVPRTNEAINEVWIADRDRYSYEGVYAADRLRAPMIREGTDWRVVDWQTALEAAAHGLKGGGASVGALVHPSSTLEECYLAARIIRGLGSGHIDHRLRQGDFRDQRADPLYPSLGVAIAEVERLEGLLIIGSNLRREVPMLAHRVRKAARGGAKIAFLNPATFPYLFPVSAYLEAPPANLVNELAAVLAATLESGGSAPAAVAKLVAAARPEARHRALAATFKRGGRSAVWLGALAQRSRWWSELRVLAAALAELTGAALGMLSEGANAAGAYLAGAIPHRGPAGAPSPTTGLDVEGMLARPLAAYCLVGVEPWADLLDADAFRTLAGARCVIAATPYLSEPLQQVAHILLPTGTFAETSGTYVNFEGKWQSFSGAAQPVAESRPAWKVLRVLGNLLALEGFDYQSSEEIRDELRAACEHAGRDLARPPYGLPAAAGGATAVGVTAAAGPTGLVDVPMYQIDSVVRRAASLQRTRDGRTPSAVY
jgi:NADH-quinone oxidoreductase subunit G